MARGIREKGETRARLRFPPQPLLQEQGKGSRLPPLLQGKKEPMPLPLILNLTFRDPSSAAEAADKNPQGRRTWMCGVRSEEHTSELQSLMRSSYAVFCL